MNYAEIARRLAAWHDGQQRALPWRGAPAGRRDAYAVWVSEIMAQQTRLDTAADYFTRWMARFPTLEALAAADQQDVLKAWEGLGYYARARNLHRAAQIVAETYGGRLPRTRRELLELPGIGSTAPAPSSAWPSGCTSRSSTATSSTCSAAWPTSTAPSTNTAHPAAAVGDGAGAGGSKRKGKQAS